MFSVITPNTSLIQLSVRTVSINCSWQSWHAIKVMAEILQENKIQIVAIKLINVLNLLKVKASKSLEITWENYNKIIIDY